LFGSIEEKGALSMKVVDLMVPANKFAETVEFYADGLGLESDTTETESIEFLIGSQKIKLVPIPGPLQRRDTHVSLHVPCAWLARMHQISRFNRPHTALRS